MPDVTATLRRALSELEGERTRLNRQIAAVMAAMGVNGSGDTGKPGVRRRRRKPMSAAARSAVSKRMKAYWAKRRKSK